MKILLLDFINNNTLVNDLRGILCSSESNRFDIAYQLIDPQIVLSNKKKYFQNIIFNNNPFCVYILFNSVTCFKVKELILILRESFSTIPIFLVMNDSDPDHLLELLRSGADEFITLPLNKNDVLFRLLKLLNSEKEDNFKIDIKRKLGLKQIVGKNPKFLSEIDKINIVSKTDSTALISGETGTGKELFARAIHFLSNRSKKPFIPLNCGAIPVDLFENELFGHERGAYTSADSTQKGLVNEVDGGTLFLDEIDSLHLASQVKLLRFLQDNEFRMVGSSKIQKADIRIIAATNVNLIEKINKGEFRQDLYYRLNIMSFYIPSLSERMDDIPLLVSHILEKYKNKFDKNINIITPEALNKLLLHSWPGNVRELENVMERAVMMASGKLIDIDDIRLSSQSYSAKGEPFKEAKQRLIKQFEINYIRALLLTFHGNISQAAKAAGKDRRAFWQLIRKHQIHVERTS